MSSADTTRQRPFVAFVSGLLLGATKVKKRQSTRAFHAAAIAAGYEATGGPGERAIFHPCYFGAFVLDPDGNVEVVIHNG
jgi:hypothetical protein